MTPTRPVIAFDLAENEPGQAEAVLADASVLAAASGVRKLVDAAATNEASLACSTGDLPRAMALARSILDKPHRAHWSDAVRELSFAALLAFPAQIARPGVRSIPRSLAAAAIRSASSSFGLTTEFLQTHSAVSWRLPPDCPAQREQWAPFRSQWKEP